MSKTSFDIERLGEVLPILTDILVLLKQVPTVPFHAVEGGFKTDEEVVCVDLPFTDIFHDLAQSG